jgi:hypothetical protein
MMLFILTGCAKSVSSIKTDQDKILTNKTGYLLIGIETNRDLKGINISGSTDILLSYKDLRQGSNFILIDLTAGKYVIEKIQLNNYWRVEMDDEDYWDIEVLPGKINYVGHISVGTSGFWQVFSHIELVNKSSYAIEFMEEKFPKILTSREIHYGGPGDDTFFDFINKKKESL